LTNVIDPRPIACVVAIVIAGAALRASPPPLAADLERVAAAAPGRLGVSVLHVESGEGASVNADEWYPMMSVYKLPIAIHALRLAERNAFDLDATVTLDRADRRPGLSPLARVIEEKGVQRATTRDLISAMLRISDNTASDALLRLAGGPRAVQRTLTALGITGIHVNRYELEFAADYYGVCCVQKERPFSLERFAAAVEKVPPARRRAAATAFLSDRRDSAQPAAMATLLARLVRGELLNAQHTEWVLAEMAAMHTRDTRLRAGLPLGARVSLRPGTSSETDGVRAACNDNAIVTLPQGRGHLVIAAFMKGAHGSDAQRDAALARAAAVAYDWAAGR
jgi:beta-lactamase class A